jgi:hypothetical protein
VWKVKRKEKKRKEKRRAASLLWAGTRKKILGPRRKWDKV